MLSPELYADIYQAAIRGETNKAIQLQAIADDFIFTVLDYDFIAVFYTMLSWCGIDAGRCRRPFHNYDDADLDGLKAKIRKLQEETQYPSLRMFEVSFIMINLISHLERHLGLYPQPGTVIRCIRN